MSNDPDYDYEVRQRERLAKRNPTLPAWLHDLIGIWRGRAEYRLRAVKEARAVGAWTTATEDRATAETWATAANEVESALENAAQPASEVINADRLRDTRDCLTMALFYITRRGLKGQAKEAIMERIKNTLGRTEPHAAPAVPAKPPATEGTAPPSRTGTSCGTALDGSAP